MEKTKSTYGFVRSFEKKEDDRTVSFILSTPARDRHHTVVNQEGWDLNHYLANPIVGFMHDVYWDADNIIGKSTRIGTEDIDGRLCLTADAYFETADVNLLADKVYRKLLLGTLSSASVGFMDDGKGRWGEGDERQGGENETYYFNRQELIEWSVVTVPSNYEANKRMMKDATMEAIDYALRSLGGNYTRSRIEEMRVADVLALLDAKDIDIKTDDPEKAQQILKEKEARDAENEIIRQQQNALFLIS